MTITISIDELACSAHGDCVHIAPHAFALDDTAVVTGTAPREILLAAARACPAVAIALVDNEAGRQIYP